MLLYYGFDLHLYIKYKIKINNMNKKTLEFNTLEMKNSLDGLKSGQDESWQDKEYMNLKVDP